MFEVSFYIGLVNAEFSDQLSTKITKAKLNQKLPRILKAIEEFLKDEPLSFGKFGHFRPARYFNENLGKLESKLSDDTKNRFEEAFKRLNSLI
ncbi:hypothetical protein [Sphingopyxis sp. BSNA05]|uniref:hypothetical protein n=1 Tax=Sphingopyxis sp. BSNA05 TaxID=1236614 RepID=UPI001C27EF19|nr:hypothetical protein [Sphingopyxis sp. BSNA05]